MLEREVECFSKHSSARQRPHVGLSSTRPAALWGPLQTSVALNAPGMFVWMLFQDVVPSLVGGIHICDISGAVMVFSYKEHIVRRSQFDNALV